MRITSTDKQWKLVENWLIAALVVMAIMVCVESYRWYALRQGAARVAITTSSNAVEMTAPIPVMQVVSSRVHDRIAEIPLPTAWAGIADLEVYSAHRFDASMWALDKKVLQLFIADYVRTTNPKMTPAQVQAVLKCTEPKLKRLFYDHVQIYSDLGINVQGDEIEKCQKAFMKRFIASKLCRDAATLVTEANASK